MEVNYGNKSDRMKETEKESIPKPIVIQANQRYYTNIAGYEMLLISLSSYDSIKLN